MPILQELDPFPFGDEELRRVFLWKLFGMWRVGASTLGQIGGSSLARASLLAEFL